MAALILNEKNGARLDKTFFALVANAAGYHLEQVTPSIAGGSPLDKSKWIKSHRAIVVTQFYDSIKRYLD